MAGHSHWANIAHKKAANDKKRAKIFSKISRKILAAARRGGGDVSVNLPLKYAIQKARAANMSNDQIKRVVDRALGVTGEGEDFEELVYEGYAPGGTAVLIEALTDNRNRTGGDLRSTFSKRGGNLGTSGSVAWQFDRKSVLRVPLDATTEDDLTMVVLEADGDDVLVEDDAFVVQGPPEGLDALVAALGEAEVEVAQSEVTYVPRDYVACDEDTARQVVALLEALEENDDVQTVHTNAEFPEGFEG